MEKIIYQNGNEHYIVFENKLFPVQRKTMTKIGNNAIILDEKLYHLSENNSLTYICPCKEGVIEINDTVYGRLLLINEKLYQQKDDTINLLPSKEYCIGKTALMIQNRIYCGSTGWYAPKMLKIFSKNDFYTLVGAINDRECNLFIKYKNKNYYHFVGNNCSVKGKVISITRSPLTEVWLMSFQKLKKIGIANAVRVENSGKIISFRHDHFCTSETGQRMKYFYETFELSPKETYELKEEKNSFEKLF